MLRITLLSADGQQFDVDATIAMQSHTIARLIQVFNVDDEHSLGSHPIPLSNITSAVLDKVLSWCNRQREDNSGEWNSRFLKIDHEFLFDLILAANYLDIPGLLEATCKHVADMIKGKLPDEIRRELCIANDLTPEEQLQMRMETAWIDIGKAPKLDAPEDELTALHPFPVLDLPNEIVAIVLEQLSPVDRLRARVNRRLFGLEAAGHYTISELSIGRGDEDEKEEEAEEKEPEDPRRLEISLIGPCSSYIDVLAKFSANTAVESLYFLCGQEERQLIPYIKSFRIRKLIVAMDQEAGKDEINDATLDSWTDGRTSLTIQSGGHCVTGDALFKLFSEMTTGHCSLDHFHISILAESGYSLLRQLEITYDRKKFISRRKDAEFFFDEAKRNFVIVIDKKIVITINKRVLNSGIEGDLSIARITDRELSSIDLQPFPTVYA